MKINVDRLVAPIYTYEPDIYLEDIRGECFNERRCENEDFMTKFLNLDDVKLRLNVPLDIEWKITNKEFNTELSWMYGTDFSNYVNIVIY